jgi:hypothetical protein
MSIVIEDGTLVSGANSYVSLTDARAYAVARGVTLPADNDDAEAVLLKAVDYLESFDSRYKGERVDRDQSLAWPRSGVTIEGFEWDSTEIPRQVLNAQLALVVEINAGEDPFNPSSATLPVVGERVEGAVAVQYASPGQSLKVSKTQPSRTHINLLLDRSGLFAVRV